MTKIEIEQCDRSANDEDLLDAVPRAKLEVRGKEEQTWNEMQRDQGELTSFNTPSHTLIEGICAFFWSFRLNLTWNFTRYASTSDDRSTNRNFRECSRVTFAGVAVNAQSCTPTLFIGTIFHRSSDSRTRGGTRRPLIVDNDPFGRMEFFTSTKSVGSRLKLTIFSSRNQEISLMHETWIVSRRSYLAGVVSWRVMCRFCRLVTRVKTINGHWNGERR